MLSSGKVNERHFGSLLLLLLLPLAPTLPSLPLSFSVPACLWSGCCKCSLPVTSRCFSVYIQVFLPPYLFLSLPIPSSHALHMHACVFTEQLFCHHATWDPVKATSGERWTSGYCLVPTHVYSDFGAKSLCDFTLDAKAFCSACHIQFTNYYKVKHQSPTRKGFLLAVSLQFASLCMPIIFWFLVMIQDSRENWCPIYFLHSDCSVRRTWHLQCSDRQQHCPKRKQETLI